MAPPWSRREVLRASSLLAVGALAGCGYTTGAADRPSVSPAPVPTGTPTGDPPADRTQPVPPARFAFDANVLQQASADGPARFRVALTNAGSRTVTVHLGAGLLWSVGGEYPDALVVLPDDYVPADAPATPADGCWRFPSDRRVVIPALASLGRLPPGDRFTTTFAVYDDPGDDRCFPAGEYRVRDDFAWGNDGRASHELNVTIDVDAGGTIAVTPRPREITAPSTDG